MRLFFFRTPTILGTVLAGLAIVLIGAFLVSQHAQADDNNDGSATLVTIHDRGVETVVVSQAKTIGDALTEAGVTVAKQDSIEPSLDEKLVASEYQVNIYRSRPVVVVDGATRQKVMTPYQTADQIASSVGISLYPEDMTTMTRNNNITADGPGLEVSITRATPFQFTLYGTQTEARTQAKTVGDMLKDKKIVLEKDDRVSVAVETPITAGLQVRVWREGKQTITVDEPVAFGVEQTLDANQFIGYKDVKVAGKTGTESVTYETVIQDGQEVSRTKIAGVVTVQPETRVEVVGIKKKSGSPAENRILGHQMMLSAGFGEDQWTCLDQLWTHESGWDQFKSNYAGSGAYGIPQALPGSKMGPGWQDDAVVQINWGLGYIKGRYGNPCGALAKLRSSNWY